MPSFFNGGVLIMVNREKKDGYQKSVEYEFSWTSFFTTQKKVVNYHGLTIYAIRERI
jgi:hypothetical protein